MRKQKKAVPMLVRVIITTVLIIAMAVTSAPIVHAADTSANTTPNTTNEAVVVPMEYDALENRLKELEKTEADNNVGLSAQKQKIIEKQIVLLNQEINKIDQDIETFSHMNDLAQNKIDTEQIKLDARHAKNVQKMQSVSASIADSCMGVLLQENSISSLVNKVSMFGQIAAADKDTISEINQMHEDKALAQTSLMNCKKRLYELNISLNEKRQEMYDCILHRQDVLEYITIGPLVDKTENEGSVIHVDENDNVWVDPCDYRQISSPFGYRQHPIYGGWYMHNGVDLFGDSRTPIYATRSGVVIESGYHYSYGYYVLIDHLDGHQSQYLHFSEPSHLKEGDVVIIGDQIGLMGTTGVSTGIHLHFGINYEGNWIDPMAYIGN